MRPDMYNVFPERIAPLNGAFGLSSGRLIAFRFDEGDVCENAPCTATLTATTRTTTKTVILGFTNDSVRRDGDRLNAFGVGSCLFIFPFRCASSLDNVPTHRQNFSPALIGSARDAAASLPSRLKQWGVRLLSTQNPAEQLHGGAGVYTAVQTCNTHIAPQSIHRIPRVGKRTSRRPGEQIHSVVGKTWLVAVSTVTVINTPRVQSWTERTELRLLELPAVVQLRAERDTDDVSNLCSFRKASAARSPMMMQGAMVLPVVTRDMIEPSAMRRCSIP